jgi:hypothetical protein
VPCTSVLANEAGDLDFGPGRRLAEDKVCKHTANADKQFTEITAFRQAAYDALGNGRAAEQPLIVLPPQVSGQMTPGRVRQGMGVPC